MSSEHWTAVVITTVQSPTSAIRAWASRGDVRVIVVGDRRTPSGWTAPGVRYVSDAEQELLPYRTARMAPWNHYARKMVGYLLAMEEGASVIIDTDDDNIPKPGSRIPSFDGEFEVTPPGLGFVNIYGRFTDSVVWPRGFPLELIRDKCWSAVERGVFRRPARVGIWQGLADGHPDVDAVFRMVMGVKQLRFRDSAPIVLDRGTVCPINSQNTAFRRDAFPAMYLPGYVTFRFTDILRGLVAQPVLWEGGYLIGFTTASVIQERNPHDLYKDFVSEIPMYMHAQRVLDLVSGAVTTGATITENLIRSYEALEAAKIVPPEELQLLQGWVGDLKRIGIG